MPCMYNTKKDPHTHTIQVHHSGTPTFIRCDLWQGNVNVYKTHEKPAHRRGFSIQLLCHWSRGGDTDGSRSALSHCNNVSDKHLEQYRGQLQLRKPEPLFFKAFYSLHYVAYTIFPVMSMLNNENRFGQ